MSQIKNISVVRSNSLFQGVNDAGFYLNFNPKDFIVIEDGGIIYQPGDLSDAIYLIIDGEIKIKISGTGIPVVVKKGRNEFFGEKETLENLARKSSAVANKNSILYMIRKNDVLSLIEKSKEIKTTLLGEQSAIDAEETVKKEIVFNEPKERLIDLPFFKKKKDTPLKDESEHENDIRNNEELSEPERTISENETNLNSASNESNKVEEPSQDDNINLHEDIINTYKEISKSEETPDPFSSFEDNIDLSPILPVDENVLLTPNHETPETISEIEMPLLIKTIRKIFSGLSTEEIFIAIPEALCELLNVESGRLYLIDKEMNIFRTRVKIDGKYSEIQIKYNGTLFADAVNEQKIINLLNPRYEELEKITTRTDIQNLLIFPLNNQKGEITGILEFNNSFRGKFNKEDESILTRLSTLITLALENADFIQNLLHSDRLISLNKIANFLIQDIKNPIVTIKQYAEHIKKQNVNEDILPVLDMIEEQSDTVMDLVQTTLRYSEGMLISKPLTILLSTAMDNILALLAEYVESRNVKLFKKYDGDGLVNLDRKEFYQACFQIAKNACDAMPQGGNFYVIVSREGVSLKIEFKDTGLGIPDSIKERIFEPFMSHGKEERTGLGLAIVEKIVKEHNGKIWAESDLGEGSVIVVVLPAAD